jgi:hypothetical protein
MSPPLSASRPHTTASIVSATKEVVIPTASVAVMAEKAEPTAQTLLPPTTE